MKIFILNCWLLPPPFSKANQDRLKQIIYLIKQHKPDIIALQEVWLNKYVSKIKNSLTDYNFVTSNSHFYNKSGLVTGLKSKDFSFQYSFFPVTKKHNLREKFAKKGYHLIELDNNLFFVNTHLYAPQNQNEKKIADSQFKLIQKLMRDKKGFVVGDLNIDENRITKLNKIFEYDKSYGHTVAGSNPLTKIRFNKYSEDKKIDYILQTKTKMAIKSKCIDKPIVSDHFCLLTKVTKK